MQPPYQLKDRIFNVDPFFLLFDIGIWVAINIYVMSSQDLPHSGCLKLSGYDSVLPRADIRLK